MADVNVSPGNFRVITIAGNGPVGGGGTPTALLPGSTTVSLSALDYAKVYVADMGPAIPGPGRLIAVVPKVTADPGGSYVVSANVTAKDASSGANLNPMSFSVQVNGPAPGPQEAANLGIFVQTESPLASAPPDPGTPSITF